MIKGKQMMFVLMEFCGGGNLGSVIKRQLVANTRVPEEQFRMWSVQLVSALHFIHAKGHVHGDIKPSNVLLNADGSHVKISDLGIARELSEVSEITFAGGTAYASPEFFITKTLSPKCDVWSLGATLFKLASLRSVIPNDSPLFIKIMKPRTFDDVTSETYSSELQSFVMSMLVVEPEDRPSMHQVARSRFLTEQRMNPTLQALLVQLEV